MGWARAVKARRRGAGRELPTLWVFTDMERLPDPRLLLAGVPVGLVGVVLRAGRGVDPAVANGVARLCRARRFALVVAGDDRLAARLRAGRHLAGGGRHRLRVLAPRGRLVTASAHDPVELVRARRSGADAVFLSPVFATASHPGALSLGTVRWAAMARRPRMAVLALGGITAATCRGLPPVCAGAGIVGAASGLAFAQGAG